MYELGNYLLSSSKLKEAEYWLRQCCLLRWQNCNASHKLIVESNNDQIFHNDIDNKYDIKDNIVIDNGVENNEIDRFLVYCINDDVEELDLLLLLDSALSLAIVLKILSSWKHIKDMYQVLIAI